MRRLVRWLARGLVVVLLLISAAMAFSVSPADRQVLQEFADAALRWRTNPEFRSVQAEYVSLGVAAMQARVLGMPMPTAVMGFRSIPGLPGYLKISEGSQAHYENFTRGELSAYLHLADEQGVSDGVGMIEKLGQHPVVGDEQLAAFLRSFSLPVNVTADAGAVASTRRLLRDVGMERFQVRSKIGPLLLRLLDDPKQMTPAQQHRALAELEDRVRRADRELWRTKQVSDFLAGIWAAGYGQIYRDGIVWTLRIQRIAQIVFIVLLFWLAFLCYRKSRSFRAEVSP